MTVGQMSEKREIDFFMMNWVLKIHRFLSQCSAEIFCSSNIEESTFEISPYCYAKIHEKTSINLSYLSRKIETDNFAEFSAFQIYQSD